MIPTSGYLDMGGYKNHGPLLGPLNTMCRIVLRTQEGTILLTTTRLRNDSVGSLVGIRPQPWSLVEVGAAQALVAVGEGRESQPRDWWQQPKPQPHPGGSK